MKQNFSFKGLLAIVLLLYSSSFWAYDFSAVNNDGKTIYYNVLGATYGTVEVTYRNDNYYSGRVSIPKSVSNNGSIYNVVGIGNKAFCGCSELTSVTIPNSITYIDSYAFYRCTGLTEVTIPESVTEIGDYAFDGCSGLTQVTIGEGVTSIGNFAFDYCTGLTQVTIPNSVTSIGDYAFYKCSGLTQVTIGEGVTSIGSYAFWICTGLTGTLTIPNGVKTIGSYAFSQCTGLTEIIIPNSVETIGSNAFFDCTGLTSVTIGESVTEIGESVTEIGERAFYNCSGLTSVTIGNNVTTIRMNAFYGCTNMKSLTIGNSVTTIGGWAFMYCSGLTSVTIPESVTYIGSGAFASCSGLKSVIIGESVTSIREGAFSGCTGLKSIYSLNPEPPTCFLDSYGVFDNVDKSSCTLYVPEGTLEAYATADEWKDFYNIKYLPTAEELYEELYEEIDSSKGMLNNVWSIITSDYANIEDDYKEEYNGIRDELNVLLDLLNGYFKNNALTYDNASEIEKKIEEINQEIEDMAEKAIKTNLSYDFFVDGIYYNITSEAALTLEATYVETASPYSKTVIIPATVQHDGITYTVVSIGNTPFSYSYDIESITLPSSITSLGQKCFSNCTKLDRVICEWESIDNVTASESTFEGVFSRAALYVPVGTAEEYNSKVPWNLFEDVEEYAPVNGEIKYSLSDGTATVTTEQSTTLSGDVVIPENVISAGEVYKVTQIADQAFLDCNNIISIRLPNTLTNISSYAFRYCKGLVSINIPSGITIIDQGVFDQCESLISIYIPDNVTSIGWGSFSGCLALKQLTIGDGVTILYDWAFSHCTALENITLFNPEPPVVETDYVFCDLDKSSCTLYVPQGAKSAYSKAEVWKDFYNIMEVNLSPVVNITTDCSAEATGYYTTDGKQVSTPQRGINIIRYADGTARKVLVK